jgi:glycosyltransferase involved in cell wall biosynthesis
MERPLISILTPSYQQAEHLEECLLSVQEQRYPHLEHLVIDGGSSDGSKQILEKHSGELKWWCSEKDGGQADALNKGLHRCGEGILGWINSDDRYLPGALEHVAEVFGRDPDIIMYEGARIIVHPDGSRTQAPGNDPKDHSSLFIAPKINQQATFYRTSAVKAVGGFDPALHYVMDLDLWLRSLFRYGPRMHVDNRPVAEFKLHASSKTASGSAGFVDEHASILHGMLLLNGDDALAKVLRKGHKIGSQLRPIEDAKGHGALVRKMTLVFLMKWHRKVHERHEFQMMKKLLRSVPEADLIDACGEEEILQLRERLSVPNWTVYRAKRKWQHLFR